MYNCRNDPSWVFWSWKYCSIVDTFHSRFGHSSSQHTHVVGSPAGRDSPAARPSAPGRPRTPSSGPAASWPAAGQTQGGSLISGGKNNHKQSFLPFFVSFVFCRQRVSVLLALLFPQISNKVHRFRVKKIWHIFPGGVLERFCSYIYLASFSFSCVFCMQRSSTLWVIIYPIFLHSSSWFPLTK